MIWRFASMYDTPLGTRRLSSSTAKLPSGQPHEIGAGDRDVEMPAQEDPAHLAPVVLRAVDQLARHDAFREDAAVVVDVAQEQIERGQALRQAALDRLPLGGGEHARQQIVGKDALGPGLIAVDGERDALLQERAIGVALPLAEIVRRQFQQAIEERAILRARLSARFEHLVEAVIELIRREQSRQCGRSRDLCHVPVEIAVADSVKNADRRSRFAAQRVSLTRTNRDRKRQKCLRGRAIRPGCSGDVDDRFDERRVAAAPSRSGPGLVERQAMRDPGGRARFAGADRREDAREVGRQSRCGSPAA